MAMQVTIDPYLPLLVSQLAQKVLGVKNLWMKLVVRSDPLSVHVNARHRVSVVAANNTIRVKTGHQHKSVVKSEQLRFFT